MTSFKRLGDLTGEERSKSSKRFVQHNQLIFHLISRVPKLVVKLLCLVVNMNQCLVKSLPFICKQISRSFKYSIISDLSSKEELYTSSFYILLPLNSDTARNGYGPRALIERKKSSLCQIQRLKIARKALNFRAQTTMFGEWRSKENS